MLIFVLRLDGQIGGMLEPELEPFPCKENIHELAYRPIRPLCVTSKLEQLPELILARLYNEKGRAEFNVPLAVKNSARCYNFKIPLIGSGKIQRRLVEHKVNVINR
jgi:hypothetical protein